MSGKHLAHVGSAKEGPLLLNFQLQPCAVALRLDQLIAQLMHRRMFCRTSSTTSARPPNNPRIKIAKNGRSKLAQRCGAHGGGERRVIHPTIAILPAEKAHVLIGSGTVRVIGSAGHGLQ